MCFYATDLHKGSLGTQHAFLRDEGPRYDPELARISYGTVVDLFRRRLA